MNRREFIKKILIGSVILAAPKIVLPDNELNKYYLSGCYSSVSGAGTPVIDFGSGEKSVISIWEDGILIDRYES